MTTSGIFLALNFIITISIYTYLMYDENTRFQSSNPILLWLRRYEEPLAITLVATTYYTILSTILLLVE